MQLGVTAPSRTHHATRELIWTFCTRKHTATNEKPLDYVDFCFFVARTSMPCILSRRSEEVHRQAQRPSWRRRKNKSDLQQLPLLLDLARARVGTIRERARPCTTSDGAGATICGGRWSVDCILSPRRAVVASRNCDFTGRGVQWTGQCSHPSQSFDATAALWTQHSNGSAALRIRDTRSESNMPCGIDDHDPMSTPNMAYTHTCCRGTRLRRTAHGQGER